MPSSLQSLPTELLGRVASFFSGWDGDHLGNLRLTCREINSKIDFQFASCYFSTVYARVSIGGLRKLLEVSRHFEFTTHVRRLHVFIDLFDPDSAAFDDNVIEFVECGSFACELGLGVGRLANLEQVEFQRRETYGYMDDYQPEMFRHIWSLVISTTMSIISKRQIHLKELEISKPMLPCCPPNMSILEPMSEKLELFDLMTSLDLDLYLEEEDDDDPGTSLTALIKILNSSKALTTLSLSFDRSYRSEKVLPKLARQVNTLPKLRKLTLSEIVFSEKSLLKFLRKQKDALKFLGLNTMYMFPGKWSHVFTFLLNELQLQTLEMMELYEEEPYGEDLAVSFKEIHAKRPLIDNFWLEDMEDVELRPDEEDMGLLKTYVHARLQTVPTMVTLTDGDGEDMREWLKMLVNHYELAVDRPFTMY